MQSVTAANPLSVANPAEGSASGTGAYLRGTAFAGNDQVAIKEYDRNWDGEYDTRSGRNLAIYTTRLEAGVRAGAWELGALTRTEWLAQYNRETADLVRQYKQGAAYPPGQQTNFDARLDGFEAGGLRLGWGTRLELGGVPVRAAVAGSLLKAQRVRIDEMNGFALGGGGRRIGFSGYRDETYSGIRTDDPTKWNEFVGKETTSGWGAALDVGMQATLHNGWDVAASINDLAGAISWSSVPNSRTSLNSIAPTYDANGLLQPAATRKDSYRSFTQHLHAKFAGSVTVPLEPVALRAGLQVYRGFAFPELSGEWKVGGGWQTGLGYDFRFRTVTASVGNRYGRLTLGTDRWDALAKAKSAAIGLDLLVPF